MLYLRFVAHLKERLSMTKKYKPKEREPRFCTECGTQLRKYYKSNETVCGMPKVTKNQSQCQLDRSNRLRLNNQAKDTTGKRCKICNKVMDYKRNANQDICNRPKGIRYLFKESLTPCQKLNKQRVEARWKDRRKMNPVAKTEEQLILEEIDQKWLPELKLPPHDGVTRRCLGILSADDELGEHYFSSAGPGNRQCPKCIEAKEVRLEMGAIADRTLCHTSPEVKSYSE